LNQRTGQGRKRWKRRRSVTARREACVREQNFLRRVTERAGSEGKLCSDVKKRIRENDNPVYPARPGGKR